MRHGAGRTIVVVGAAVLLLTAIGGVARAQFAPLIQQLRREPLPPYDKRLAAGPQPAAAPSAAVRGVRVDRDPVVDSPRFVGSPRGFLTGPLPAPALGGATDALAPVRNFIDAHRGIFGHGSETIAGAVVRRDYVTARTGLRTVVWEQVLDGIVIFEGTLQAHLTARGELVNLGSRLLPDPAGAARRSAAARAALVSAPPFGAREAVAIAGRNLGANLSAAEVTAPEGQQNSASWQSFSATPLSGVVVRPVWLPIDGNTLRFAWEVVCTSRARSEMFRVVVDAETGEPTVRQSLTENFTPASYRVFTSDSPSPFSPGQTTPSTTQPAVVARTLVTTSALNPTASPNGWIDDGVTETRGNNVDAHTDVDANDVADLPRPQAVGAGRVFDPALDLAQAPSTYRDAAVVNLFYWCNWTHDQLYDLGFTEAAGNFQNNNFGRGGVGNDAIQADAQDGSGTDNANFSTPPDGSPGRMQMYVFTGPSPQRDGDFDQEIIIHEYVHGLSNRLVGGGVGISALAPRGMGEGWSDFYALALLSEASDNVNGNYAMGGYATYQLSGLTQNYYYGIRRYPYSTDLAKNPLTFRDIDPTQANAHTGIPRSPIIGSTADEVHNMGEVWCVTLWDARANLVTKLGFTAGNRLILQLVTDGMKLAPANPNFLQARDAILQAELVATGGAHRNELWAAFAKRGMGANATAPSSSTTVGLVENFDIPDDLAISPNATFAATGVIGGPFTPGANTYTLVNSGSSALSWTAVKSGAWFDLSATAGTINPGGNATVTATINASANALNVGTYPGNITITNTSSGVPQARAVSLAVQPVTIPIFTEDFESGVLDPARWTTSGTSTPRAQITTANGPHGGARHLTMDSSADNGVYSRNEATLSVNLAGQTDVQLRFWAKIFNDEPDGPPPSPFVGGADFDGVAMSADGTTWYEIQPLRSPLVSGTWTQFTVDLDAAIALRGLAYSSNFKIRFNQYDNFAIITDGIAIDDIAIVRVVTNRVTFTVPATLAENSAPVTGVVSATPTPSSPLTVALVSSLPGTLAVPANVTIPGGQPSATFTLTPVDDALLNGTRAITLTGNATLYSPATANISILDNETATLGVTLPASVTEGAAGVTGTVTVSAAPAVPVTVALSSDAPANAQPPATVTIPAGQTSATFVLAVPNDTQINGTRSATITAFVSNWTSGAATVSILDDETTALAFTLPPVIREGDTGLTGTVRLTGTLAGNLTVSLASNRTSELTVPATATIVAGQTSATFPITVIDDAATDGAQTVQLSASAAGFTGVTANVSVADNDVHHFAITTVTSPQIRNAPFTITVTAQDVNNVAITNFSGNVTLAAASGATPVAITPTALTGFVNGVWSGPMTVTAFATNVVLTASDAATHAGTSNAFDVTTGSLHHFVWGPLPSPQLVNTPFAVTLTAQDAGNNTVNFNGTANLTASLTGTVEMLSWITYADTTTTGYGEYYNGKRAISTYFANFNDTATTTLDAAVLATQLVGKHVFWIPEQEYSSSSTLDSLGTAWSSVLNSFVSSGGTIIACSNTTSEHLLFTRSGLLDLTPVSSPSTIVNKVLDNELTAGVAASFGGSFLHAYSTTNGTVSAQVAAGQAVVISRNVGSGRAIMVGSDFYTIGTDMDRILANAVSTSVAPAGSPVATSPGSVTFAAGTWSGNVSVPITGTGMRLTATSGSVATASPSIAVIPPPTLAIALPASLREGDAPKAASVTLSSALSSVITVNLSSSDTTAVTVPASITIPAGQTSVTFNVTIIDDTVADGSQPFTISASSAGLATATASGLVRDNEAHHFTFATIASPQLGNGPVPAILTARDAADAVMADYNSPVTITASGAGGPLAVTPSVTGSWSNGMWNGSVQINAVTTGVTLSANDGLGHTGSSNSFSLVSGSLDHFEWNTVASPQALDTPFPVTIRAVNSGGATETNYNGVANLSVLYPVAGMPAGTGASALYYHLSTYYPDSRTQTIYPASLMGGAARITALAFNVGYASSEVLTNFTIRLKHTALGDFSSAQNWDNAGWTTVYRASPTVNATGWMTFVFTTPFDYNGTSNLMIDWSMDRATSNYTYTYLVGTDTSTPVAIIGSSFNADGDPLAWSGTSPYPSLAYGRPNLVFTTIREVPVRPLQTAAFASGVWSGQVSLPVAGTALALRARAGSAAVGTSNAIDVSTSTLPGTGGASVFAEDFESGVPSSAWTISGTGPYHVLVTSANGPRAGRHLTLDASTYGTYARNEATLTVNLAGRSGVGLSFWARSFNDVPNGPPPSPFPGTGADFDGVAISADGGSNWYEVQPLRSLTGTYTQYSVDLDAAIASRGLVYGSNFKIRFNQYGYDYIPYQGIAIDDVAVTANPLTGFAVTVPAQAAEGAGILTGSVTLDAVRASDTVFTLLSSAPAKASVPSAVTIPAGQLSVSFSITVPDDAIIDGNRTVAISAGTASIPGSTSRAAYLQILDNDISTLTLSVPSAAVETVGVLTGTVTLGTVSSGTVAVLLTSGNAATATVPASVTFAPGQTAASFPITVLDNTAIDGTRVVSFTANVPGWTTATANLTVTDNETNSIFLYSSSVNEGGTNSMTVAIGGTLPTNLTINLASSNTARLTVPATVVIPFGQTYGYFNISAPDNPTADGTASVAVTASATGFLTGTGNVQVYDNDAHHFGFSTIAASQATGVPFGITVTALDVSGNTVTGFNGTATLSGAGDGGAVTIAPTTVSGFYYGSWSGNLSVNQPGTNVRLTATSGGATGQSNGFNVAQSPAISVSPSSFAIALATGSTTTRTLTLGNTGGGTLNWSLGSSSSLRGEATAGPVFSGGTPIAEDKAHARPPALGQAYSAPRSVGSSAGILSSAAPPSLASVLAGLNISNGPVRGSIPNRYAFSEGVTGNSIGDGGNDMYDGGNLLSANLVAGSYLNYSDNVVVSSALLGAGGQYFTRKYDGLWVFAADINGLGSFQIDGNLGADGGGSTDTAVLSLTYGGTNYRGFVKRVYNAGDPSVNHLIIVPDNGIVVHDVATDTNNDYHRVSGLSAINRIYYLLYAGSSGAYIDNTAALAIMTNFLDAATTPDWIVPSASSGSIAASGSQNITLTIGNAALSAGNYTRTLVFSSNDPLNPASTVPVNLTLTSPPSIEVTPVANLTASGLRGGPFAPTNLTYTLTNPGPSAVNWTVTKSAAWLDLSATGGTLASGANSTVTAALNASANTLTSGSYTDIVTFTNTTNGIGNTTRGAALSIAPAGELAVTPAGGFSASGPAGGPFAPATMVWTLSNTGDAPMNWTATNTQPWFVLSTSGGTLAPGATTTLTAFLSGSAAALPVGAAQDSITLTNTTNGRGNTTRSLDLAVRPSAPVLVAEPLITGGATNTVSWSSVPGATEYEVQVASDSGFTSPLSSGWVAGTSRTFALADGTWYFRVRARQSVAGTSAVWSQTSKAEFDTGTKSNVDTTVGGDVVLSGSANGPIAGRIQNASFETGPFDTLGTVTGWASEQTASMGTQAAAYPGYSPMPTAGAAFGHTYSFAGSTVTPGAYARLYQFIDLTGGTTFEFDAKIVATGSIQAQVRIDGVTLWSASTPGNYLNQSVNISGYTGVHVVELRGAIVSSTSDSQWVLWDNLRLNGAGGYVSAGTLVSPVITPVARTAWSTLGYSRDISAAGTSLTIDVLNSAGSAVLASNLSPGTNLALFPAVASQVSLRLRANLATAQPANTPLLQDWSVGYLAGTATVVESPWSASVSSVQDATAPAVAVTTPATSTSAAYTLAGTVSDAAGVLSLTVNGVAASTADSFAHWTMPATLSSGANTFTVVATDRAVPANVSTATFTVTYVSGVAPVFSTHPSSATVATGATANFTVAATGVPAPVYQWRKNGVPLPGETGATLTIGNAQPAEAGVYSASASNAAGVAVSNNASLAVTSPANAPAITVQPVSQVAAAGQGVSFSVTATGTGPLSYQWRKNTVSLGAAGTGASLSLANVQAADIGAYSVLVANAFGSALSRDAGLSVLPAGFSATHAVVGQGYIPGGFVTVTTTLNYTGTISALGYQMLLPSGWSYLSGGGSEGPTKPVAGEVELLEWAWVGVPASPVTFTTMLKVPSSTSGAQSIVGLVVTQPGPIQFLAQPDPLLLNPTTTHSGDTTQDFRIDLLELTRVIELYNTRNGTTRTGRYQLQDGTEDGFASDPITSAGAVVTLARYHAGDTDRDGRISLLELTRVIELYNYRNGTTRTGQYHVQAGTEDGFATGP